MGYEARTYRVKPLPCAWLEPRLPLVEGTLRKVLKLGEEKEPERTMDEDAIRKALNNKRWRDRNKEKISAKKRERRLREKQKRLRGQLARLEADLIVFTHTTSQ